MGNIFSSTDPSPYDQVIILSQKTINDSFKNMWELAQLDDDSPLKHFKIKIRGGSFLEVDIGQPSVELCVTVSDPMLYFKLKMASGKLKLYLSDDDEDESAVEWDVKNWVFAFSVTIAQKRVEKGSEEYKDFQRRSGLSESNFTLARLFIDTSSTTTWKTELSDFGDKQEEFDKLSDEAKSTFDTFIQKWLNKMNRAGCNILGYSAQREHGNEMDKYIPTFPPTSIDYATYPWKERKEDHPRDGDNRNALCYLMMSNFTTPPLPRGLPYSMNFVDEQQGAVYCMNRSLFWPWMHSVLRTVVVGMVPVAHKPYLRWDDSDPDHPFVTGMSYHFGDADYASSSYYDFHKSGDRTWSFGARPIEERDEVRNPHRGNDYQEGVQETNKVLTFKSGNELPARGGELTFDGNEITLSGLYTFLFRVDHNTGNRNRYTILALVARWTFALAMAAVDDGGLIFRNTDRSKVEFDPPRREGNLSWNSSPDGFTTAMRKHSKDNFDSVEKSLLRALSTYNRLFLPAKGTFLMKDPEFNHNGDLMVRLTYNGADPPEKK